MIRIFRVLLLGLTLACHLAHAQTAVPTEIQQPGTQPREVGNLESPDKCDNCHGGYNRAVEPAFNWRGSMMANAGRDPIFWATLAIAEQDFPGAGDLCVRCHSTAGWLAGRSTPTDGSGLAAGDADGVDCDTCHKMSNPDDSEHLGVMRQPFVANDGGNPAEGYHGSGMLSIWPGSQKLGPYHDATAKHQFLQSRFHRDVDFCGSCHDVSNPAVGDLAHNSGAQPRADAVIASQTPGSPITTKAAFNNLPFRYGVVERTFSEYKSGLLSRTRVSSYPELPIELQAGAIKAAYDSAGGDYADGAPRYFSCQTCHLRAVTGVGANKAGTPTRKDLPLHDMTGGNVWAPDAILYQNARGTLRLGGGLSAVQIDAIKAGKERARQQLRLAASLAVDGNTLNITNLTGHKLISGYPEGRRMWLNMRWFSAAGTLLREDGKYGDLSVTTPGAPASVRTIITLSDPNTKIYEAQYGMTRDWAQQLLELGYKPEMPLAFHRRTGAVSSTLAEFVAGTAERIKTFHFVLNNTVMRDNRIPPWGMSYDEARKRNALPTPVAQYGSPGIGGTYRHWDEVALNPPDGATYASIQLLYQSTSWEYIQFLLLANERRNSFLADEGRNLLDAWVNTGMAEPVVMASATWGTAPTVACEMPGVPQALTATSAKRAITLSWNAGAPSPGGGYRIHYNQAGKLQYRAGVSPAITTYKDSGLSRNVSYSYAVTAWNDCNLNGVFDAETDRESAASATATAVAL